MLIEKEFYVIFVVVVAAVVLFGFMYIGLFVVVSLKLIITT